MPWSVTDQKRRFCRWVFNTCTLAPSGAGSSWPIYPYIPQGFLPVITAHHCCLLIAFLWARSTSTTSVMSPWMWDSSVSYCQGYASPSALAAPHMAWVPTCHRGPPLGSPACLFKPDPTESGQTIYVSGYLRQSLCKFLDFLVVRESRVIFSSIYASEESPLW